jgi:hypothetical protein
VSAPWGTRTGSFNASTKGPHALRRTAPPVRGPFLACALQALPALQRHTRRLRTTRGGPLGGSRAAPQSSPAPARLVRGGRAAAGQRHVARGRRARPASLERSSPPPRRGGGWPAPLTLRCGDRQAGVSRALAAAFRSPEGGPTILFPTFLNFLASQIPRQHGV